MGRLKFGGGVTETVLNPAVLLVILIAGVIILFWPRKTALSAFLGAGLIERREKI